MNYNQERANALHWWNGLDKWAQIRYFNSYKDENFTPATTPEELTGREIQIIYRNENQ